MRFSVLLWAVLATYQRRGAFNANALSILDKSFLRSSPMALSAHAPITRRTAWEVASAVTAGAASPFLSGIQNSGAERELPTDYADIDDISPVSSKPAVPTVRLGGGKSSLEVSRTIQGHWQLSGGHGRFREPDAIENMKGHLDSGIFTLDTADVYGPSEIICGKFAKSNPQAVVCTKFCCFRYLDEITKSEVRQRVLKSCERLQVQKLPLLAFFWSDYSVKRYVDVALWLTELKEEGLIQEIGATNFDLKRLKELKNAGVPIVSHQVQMSALDRRPVQSGMVEWCAENDIDLLAFGTVGGGILSRRYLDKGPLTQEEKNTASLRMYSNTANRFGSWKLVQELLQTMDAIATEARKDGRCLQATIANVAQRYVLQTPGVASILIGVRNQEHVLENVRSHQFSLTQAEIDTIDKVVAKRSGPVGDVWDLERGIISEMKKEK